MKFLLTIGEKLATEKPFIVNKPSYSLGAIKIRKKQSGIKVTASVTSDGRVAMHIVLNSTSSLDNGQTSITIPPSLIDSLPDNVTFVALALVNNHLYQSKNQSKGEY